MIITSRNTFFSLFIIYSLVLSCLCTGCHTCIENSGLHFDDGKDYNYEVVAHWENLWQAVPKPGYMSVYSYCRASTAMQDTLITPDGGVVRGYPSMDQIFIYKDRSSNVIEFIHMSDYRKATIQAQTEQKEDGCYIQESYLIWGDTKENIQAGNEKDTPVIDYYPRPFTKLLYFHIEIDDLKSFPVVSCNGMISGISNQVRMYDRMPTGDNCILRFIPHRKLPILHKQIILPGYLGNNKLTLVFLLENGREVILEADLENDLKDMEEDAVTCKITIYPDEQSMDITYDLNYEKWTPDLYEHIEIK